MRELDAHTHTAAIGLGEGVSGHHEVDELHALHLGSGLGSEVRVRVRARVRVTARVTAISVRGPLWR